MADKMAGKLQIYADKADNSQQGHEGHKEGPRMDTNERE
jgi:hypothetical protein